MFTFTETVLNRCPYLVLVTHPAPRFVETSCPELCLSEVRCRLVRVSAGALNVSLGQKGS